MITPEQMRDRAVDALMDLAKGGEHRLDAARELLRISAFEKEIAMREGELKAFNEHRAEFDAKWKAERGEGFRR